MNYLMVGNGRLRLRSVGPNRRYDELENIIATSFCITSQLLLRRTLLRSVFIATIKITFRILPIFLQTFFAFETNRNNTTIAIHP